VTGTPLRLLLIEDSEDDAFLLIRELRNGGFDPAVVRVDAAPAMRAELDKRTWDLVIADYNMPRFSGIEALELVKSTGLDLPFIIVSGAIGEETAVGAMRAGAHDYIMKDNLARLIPAINRELREAQMRGDRRRVEAEKERIQAQLIQSQRMEAIGVMSGGIAHDFNNLLTAILGSTELAMGMVEESNPLWEELNQIQIAAMRASGLTRQLLLFSRKQKMEFVPINVNHIIQNSIKLLQRMIGEDIRIVTLLEPDPFSVKADRGSLELSIMNLALNARDAMPGGGVLTIRTENAEFGESDSRTTPEARPGRFIRLSVVDTGIGIDPKTQTHIFDPFFSTKGVGQGTGLGLSVVHGIVKQHSGWISVSSRPGEGAAFVIYLPAIALRPQVESKEKISIDAFRGGGERILIVEDEIHVLNYASKALRMNGYTVFSAHDVKEALELFEAERGEFDLILCDVVLPDRNGLELAEELRSRRPELKILMSSGYIGYKSRVNPIRKEGFPFLAKPYTLIDLLRTVQESIRGKTESEAGSAGPG
jgi:two-component system, cell cycle sensor histidine kinase and response regulator CckA